MADDGDGSGQVRRAQHDSPFFRSKFRVPTTPQHYVRRPRLITLLDDLADYPVTALVAPAGAGKTALAADWIRLTGRRTVWLALDDSDRHAPQLLTALAAAVDHFAPGCAQDSLSVLRRPGEPQEVVHVLVEALEEVEPERAVLVIDDVHLVDDDPAAAACLASFVEHKPPWLDLLLMSRRQLALPVDRLRAAGALADLTFDALRFTEAEAIEMLAALCPDVAAEDLPDVTDWAGGWAAALQLAALAVRSQRAPTAPTSAGSDAPAGSGRLVDEYLWHEVLRAERPDVIGLLLDVAVVDRVNYPLAEALTDRPDAGDILAEAERRGLFVTSLESGGWFEVHALVRDLLLAELERRWPERLRDQHARAARWFETADDSTSALEHWLAADMPREALRLLAALAVDLFESGRVCELRRMADQVSATFPESDLRALVELAWCRLFVDRDSFEAAMAAVEATEPDPDCPPGRLLILHAASALVSGDWRRCEDRGRDALAATEGALSLDTLGRFGWSLVAHGVALDERWLDGSPEVSQLARGVSNDALRSVALEGTRAFALALAGHPLDAMRTSAGVRHVAESGDLTTLLAELSLADAIATRELGDSGAARQLLERLAGSSTYPTVFVQLLAQLELVELHLSNGDLEAAESALRTATATCAREHRGPGAASALARRGVVVALTRRDHEAADDWAGRVQDSFWGPVSRARIALARRRPPEAAEALQLAVPRCARHQVVLHLLVGRSLREGERGSAEKEVATAVEIASRHGMLETVGAEGRDLLDLLELSAWRVPDGWMRRLRHVVVGSDAVRQVPGVLVDELTARERDVLRLLPTRLTLREVAGELFVSPNTLKFHLRVIYQKLGVNSRAEAVETARRLGLMSGS